MKKGDKGTASKSTAKSKPAARSVDGPDLLEHLLQLNADCAARGDYEVAYHLLAAAQHAAEGLHSADGLRAVRQRAREQQTAIDRHPGGHPLSTAGARSRGTAPLFDTLGLTSEAALLRLETELARRRGTARNHGIGWPG
jgi:hypothetical protein